MVEELPSLTISLMIWKNLWNDDGNVIWTATGEKNEDASCQLISIKCILE